MPSPLMTVCDVTHRYRDTVALAGINLTIFKGQTLGLIGPDGVGKSTLLALVAGARELQHGDISVLGESLRWQRGRARLYSRIAYMPQGLGKNLYPSLSVYENVNFFAGLYGLKSPQRQLRIMQLLESTGLAEFKARPAGKLSGGMKQKLGLCCALIHDPECLILDEPTTGIDPLSRRQFWQLIDQLKKQQPQLTLVVATASLDEAARFEQIVSLQQGKIIAQGTPSQFLAKAERRVMAETFHGNGEIAIEAHNLTMRFGDFIAVKNVNLQIQKGEIFGFLGSNGCGKTTTMKMLTGLLHASSGQATLFGIPVQKSTRESRLRVGYMTQQFSLFNELTVRQNLELHARLYGVPKDIIDQRIAAMAEQFELSSLLAALPQSLPLGERQRLSLAVAMIHEPELLILDEPTSGVDPVARDKFWRIMLQLAREKQVTIFISTHYMNEAERCDRISLMHAGEVLVTDTPQAIIQAQQAQTLDDAFVGFLQQASSSAPQPSLAALAAAPSSTKRTRFSWQRMMSYLYRETLEIIRDPIRLVMATLGSVILMAVLGYGMNMDIENLKFAVLDRDNTAISRDYGDNLSGSRYFEEQPPVADYAELNERMRAGSVSLVLEIPSGFARDLYRGDKVEIGAWIDGSLPMRGENVRGYVQGMHAHWLQQQARGHGLESASVGATIESRFRYNPDVKSLPAMMPAVIPLLLLMFPAILTSLAVVREKELGSIVNFYVTPTTKLEFLIGKQIPYVIMGMANYVILMLMAVYLFEVPITGSLSVLTLATLFYVIIATIFGLIMSAFVRSQIAALFGTTLATILPAAQFSGLITPVPSLEGGARIMGEIFPTTYHIIITRGVFSKALQWGDLWPALWPLLISIPILMTLGVWLLRKQER